MSGVSIQMRGQSFESIQEMAETLKNEINAELINENYRSVGLVNICVLSFEKYFFRNGSYAGLTIVLTEDKENKTADVIGSGGGEGFFNISWGANQELASETASILKSFGLVVQ